MSRLVMYTPSRFLSLDVDGLLPIVARKERTYDGKQIEGSQDSFQHLRGRHSGRGFARSPFLCCFICQEGKTKGSGEDHHAWKIVRV